MRKDTDEQHKAFVHMVDPLSSEVTYACQFPRLPNSIYKWFHLNISVVILCPEKNRFVRSPCPSRHVLYLRCSHLGGLHCSILRIAFGERYFSKDWLQSTECGRRTSTKELEDVSRDGQMSGFRSASETDWPWHASLVHRSGHGCDATIVGNRWLLTSAKCFRGYFLLPSFKIF